MFTILVKYVHVFLILPSLCVYNLIYRYARTKYIAQNDDILQQPVALYSNVHR